MKNSKKGKDPAFLFYTSDFLTGTMLLTNEQVGMYIRLMCLQHQKGKLTEKDMLNICKSYDEDVFQKFIKDEHGLYYNERLSFEIQRRIEYSKSRSENRKSKNISTSYVPHMENENETINSTKSEEVFFTIEHCLTVALNDGRWTKANKTNEKELTEFNSLLEKRGIYKKNPLDYKTHFANWKRTGKKDIQEPETSNQNYRLKKITA
jgi:uncharacterized protein YdaU (DUF1376 family)